MATTLARRVMVKSGQELNSLGGCHGARVSVEKNKQTFFHSMNTLLHFFSVNSGPFDRLRMKPKNRL
jgi:hypothetical protein